MTHSFLSPCISLAITQPAHPSGAVGAPDDLLPLLSECVSHTGTEGGSHPCMQQFPSGIGSPVVCLTAKAALYKKCIRSMTSSQALCVMDAFFVVSTARRHFVQMTDEAH